MKPQPFADPPAELVRALIYGHTYVFVGAGMSIAGGGVGWEELLKLLKEEGLRL
jgi:hypothetical protein